MYEDILFSLNGVGAIRRDDLNPINVFNYIISRDGTLTTEFASTNPPVTRPLNGADELQNMAIYIAWLTWWVPWFATQHTPPYTWSGDLSNPIGGYQGPAWTYDPATGYATNGVPIMKNLVSLTVSPTNPAGLQIGATQQFTCLATYSDGSTGDVTDYAGWHSSNPAIASIIISSGLATGLTVGSTSITAISGVTSNAVTLNVVAAAPQLTYISVAPNSPASLAVGTTQQFTATGLYSDGSTADLTSQVSWETADPGVASISLSGLATGIASGTTVITAALYPISSTPVTLTVGTAKKLSYITVTPANPSNLGVGSTLQFTATGNYSDGSTADITSQVIWTSTSAGIATIETGGLAHGLASGSTTIIAALYLIMSVPVTLTVGTGTTATLASINVAPDNPYDLGVGSTQQFTATGVYSDWSTENLTAQVTWESSDTAVAIISPDGLVTAVAAGITAITATLSSITSTPISLTVISITNNLASIAVSPSSPSLVVGDTLQFHATGTYSDGSVADITSEVTWASSNTDAAAISSGGMVTGIAAGTTAITAFLSPVTSTPVSLTVTSTPGPGPAGSGNYWESLLPMPPQDGPPLPSFLGVRWPWQKPLTPPGNLQITVYDANTTKPLQSAAVTVTPGTKFLIEVFERSVAPTDINGFCSFTVPVGTYFVQCAKMGYDTQAVQVVVSASGGKATVNLGPSA